MLNYLYNAFTNLYSTSQNSYKQLSMDIVYLYIFFGEFDVLLNIVFHFYDEAKNDGNSQDMKSQTSLTVFHFFSDGCWVIGSKLSYPPSPWLEFAFY